jgi:DNA-binding PadR family transcriptional regulator
MKHTAIVPKGFLRYQLLKLLNEKPMSGSEIMSELENQTKGYWKPSPGSIYPLLSWLQDKGYIREADEKEPGIRRYTLTEQGKTFLGNEAKSREEIDRRIKQFRSTGGFFGPMWFGFDREDTKELSRVARDFSRAARGLFHELRKEHSQEAVAEARKALEEATKQILDATTKLQG